MQYHETSELMSETPTPRKSAAPANVPVKRGALALPPRGQTLARLQDLEQESDLDVLTAARTGKDTASAEVSNAVITASSNAVSHQGSNAVRDNDETGLAPVDQRLEGSPEILLPSPSQNLAAQEAPPTSAPRAAGGSEYQAPTRPLREPTTRITVDMPDSLHQKIAVLSAQTRRSIKDLVIEALAATYFAADTNRQ